MSQTHWQRISDHYRSRIESGELLPGARIPSDARLAEEWGVSRPTAHRALHELQRLGLVNRSKGAGTVVVERVAKANGRVALIVDRMVPRYNFPHSDLIRGIQDGLGEEVSVVIAQSDDDYRREARQLSRLSEEVDGILIYPTSDPRNNELMDRIRAEGTPIVALDRYPEGLHTDLVLTDNYGATRQAVRMLAGKGHRRIGFFSFHKPDFSSVQERYDAYRSVMAENGVELTQPMTRWFPQTLEMEPHLLVQAVQDSLHALTRSDEPITALFCVEDFIAAVVLEAAECLEIQVPNRLEIAFFNDWPPMMYRTPWGLHRIVQSVYGIGKAAAEVLKDRMSGDASEPRLVRVPADLHPAEELPPLTALSPASTTFSPQANGGY
ncbi:MAG TPA: GntR family transcriptional regulator [Fimbriimonas sp.]